MACTETHIPDGPVDKCIILEPTFSTADGSFADYTVTTKFDGTLQQLVVVPGTTTPQANFDVTLTDADSVDLLYGRGLNLAVTGSTQVPLNYYKLPSRKITTSDVLTLSIANNNVTNATVSLSLYYR